MSMSFSSIAVAGGLLLLFIVNLAFIIDRYNSEYWASKRDGLLFYVNEVVGWRLN